MVCALVSSLPAFGGTDVGDDGGKRSGHQRQLCLAVGPELRARIGKRCRRHLKPTNKSWRLDETYIKVKGQERFLNRAVDSTGQTIDFLLTAKRDAIAAKRFFRRALAQSGNLHPRVINVDKNRAYPTAVHELKQEGTIRGHCRLRQVKFLNNIVEQDHRNMKTTDVARQGLRVGKDGLANPPWNRSNGDDPERKSKASSKGRCGGSGEVRREAVRHRRIIFDR